MEATNQKSLKPLTARASLRRQQMLEAATEIFLEHGYEATSLDSVIERVGGSRRNVYEQFGNKEGLFAAVVTHVCASLLDELASADLKDKDPAEALALIGETFLEVLLRPSMLAFYRVIVGESARFPEFGQLFFRSGPEVAYERLSEYLTAQAVKGRLSIEDPGLTAKLFLEMVKSDLHLWAILDPAVAVTKNEIRLRVTLAVQIVLNGIQVR